MNTEIDKQRMKTFLNEFNYYDRKCPKLFAGSVGNGSAVKIDFNNRHKHKRNDYDSGSGKRRCKFTE